MKERDAKLKLRQNVAGILVQSSSGKILICERYNSAGAWQFPQGGVDAGESLEEALVRELYEEISLKAGDYTILEKKGPYQYMYGERRLVKGHHGKVQHYFLAQLDAPISRINVATEHPEFRNVRWILPGEFKIKWLPEMKHAVYRAVFKDFFGVAL
ncbi:MAG: NUDIX domain-containing protein [Verrucomicrobiota bacterium]